MKTGHLVMQRIRCVLPAILLVAASLTDAATLSGQIVSDRGVVLSYAPVQLLQMVSGATPTGMNADSTGRFFFTNLTEGMYTVRVNYVGFCPWSAEVSVGSDTSPLHVVLNTRLLSSEDVLVTATRSRQASNAASVSFDIVTENEMVYRNVESVDQALESVNGLQVFRSHSVATNSVSIRGSSDVLGGGVGNRVLLLVDGRPALLPASGGQAWSLLPLAAVERVEVVKGAFSSLYGSAAMGGVINLITRSPSVTPQTVINARTGFHEPPPDWMEYRDGVASFTGFDVLHSACRGDVGYLFQLGRQSSDGHKESSDYTVWQAFGKTELTLNSLTRLGLSAAGGWSRAGYPHRWRSVVEPLKVKSAQIDDRQNKEWWNTDFSIHSLLPGQSVLDGAAYVYGNNSETVQPASDSHSDYSSIRIGGRLQWQREFFGTVNQTVGVEAINDHVWSDSLLYGDRTTYSYSMFSLSQISLRDLARLELGVRYDNVGLPGSNREHQINPKIGVSVPLGDTFSLRASAGRAFRTPSIAERFLVCEPAGGTEFEPNDSLRAEKSVSYELGITHTLQPYLHLDIAGFVTDYDDWIFWQELDPVPGGAGYRFQVANLLKVRMAGIDAAMKVSPADGFTISVNYLYLVAEDRTPGREDDVLPYRPRHTVSGSMTFSHGRLSTSATVRSRSRVEETVFSAYRYDAPGSFAVVDLHSDYDILSWLNVGIDVDNVFNYQYEEMARYRMPGRTYSIAVRMTH